MSNGTKRKPAPKPQSGEATEAEATQQVEQRENSGGYDSEIEGVTLQSPALPAESSHYLEMVDKFQTALMHTEIRVTHATIPTSWAPERWRGEHAGFPVSTGDVFKVKTNKGKIIVAKE